MKKKNKIKLLLVSSFAVNKAGGIGTWTRNLTYFLDNISYDYKLLDTEFEFKQKYLGNSITRILLGAFDSIMILSKLLVFMLRFKPEVVHYTSSGSLALIKDYFACILVRSVFNKKFIVHWRFGRIPELLCTNCSEKKWLLKVMKKANISIVIDESTYRACQTIKEINVTYIPNPISEKLQKISNHIFDTKVVEDGKVVFVGQVLESKGVKELIQACNNLNQLNQLMIIGPVAPSMRETLLSLANQDLKDKIVFKGEVHIEQVWPDIINACCLCLPSYTEGFPNVVLEAMALATPVVATPVGAIPEMLKFREINRAGLCVPVQEVLPLHNALKEILQDSSTAKRMGEEGRLKVLNNFTLRIVVSEYMKLWNSD